MQGYRNRHVKYLEGLQGEQLHRAHDVRGDLAVAASDVV